MIRPIFAASLLVFAPCALAQQAPAPAPAVSAPASLDARPVTPIQQMAAYGRGPVPMILIPNIGFDWTVWESFMKRNGERYTMYAVTLPGICGTEAPELRPKENWEAMVLTTNAEKAIERLIKERGLDRPVIMGHGYGGHLAMRFALAHPELTRAIISIDGMPSQPLADPQQNQDLEEKKAIIRDALAPQMLRVPDEEWRSKHFISSMALVSNDARARELGLILNKNDRGVATFYFLESLLSDVQTQMDDLTVPLLCIAPMSPDGVPPQSITKSIWETHLGAPPNTTLAFYSNCRHFVMDDDPQQLDFDVDLFVRGQPVPGARRTVGTSAPAPEAPASAPEQP